MMKHTIAQIRAALRGVRLRADERQDIWEAFAAFADMHPARDVAAAQGDADAARTPAVWTRVAGAAAVVVVVTLGSAAYAAEHSLPNSALYRVKTEVYEPVLLATVAPFPRVHAALNVELIERRFNEIEHLAAIHDLEPAHLMQVSQLVATRTAAVSEYMDAHEDHTDAYATSLVLESVLEAHEITLDSLDALFSPDTSDAYHVLRMVVANAGESAEDRRIHFEHALEWADEQTRVRNLSKVVAELSNESIASDADVQAAAAATGLRAEASALRLQAAQARAEADAYLEAGDTGRALRHYGHALQNQEKAAILSHVLTIREGVR